MAKKILIMGLPGAGKTTLASKLVPIMKAKWLNADKIRSKANDWDFSFEGRNRQAIRMAEFANEYKKKGFHVIADFICPTPESRKSFNPDIIIWMNTIKESRFDDTNEMFVNPDKFDFEINSKNAEYWAPKIAKALSKIE